MTGDGKRTNIPQTQFKKDCTTMEHMFNYEQPKLNVIHPKGGY